MFNRDRMTRLWRVVVSRKGRYATAAAIVLALIALVPLEQEASPPETTPDTSGASYVAVARGRVDIEGGLIQLAARRDGIIKSVSVEEGDTVQKDQILAMLDDRQAHLNLDLARRETAQSRLTLDGTQVRLHAAEREAARLRELVAAEAAARAELDTAQDQVALIRNEHETAQAAAAAAKARERLAAYEIEQRLIRAPMNGRIVRRQARPGDGVSTVNVTPLFWFAQDAPRIVRAELEERFIELVTPGMPADIVLEGAQATVLPAQVQRVGLLFGPKRPVTDDPYERSDARVVECILALAPSTAPLVLGQRVLVRFKPASPTSP